MKSQATGKITLTYSTIITGITNLGIFVLVNEKEYFIPFSKYDVFKKATVEEIYDCKLLSPSQLYWEQLDCDIEIDALDNPEKYVLIYK